MLRVLCVFVGKEKDTAFSYFIIYIYFLMGSAKLMLHLCRWPSDFKRVCGVSIISSFSHLVGNRI